MVSRKLDLKCFESNQISRASWRVTNIWAQRVVALLLSYISPTDTEFARCEIPVTDIVGSSYAGTSYKTLRENVAQELNAQSVVFYDGIKDPRDFIVISLFEGYIRYSGETDTISIALNSDLAPYYLELKKNFTAYSAREFMGLKSRYTQSLFRYLVSWHSMQEHIEPLQRLNLLLNTTPALRRSYTELDRKALAPAWRNIMTKTSLEYRYEPVKEGRKVKAVRFLFDRQEVLLELGGRTQEEYDDLSRRSFQCYKKHLAEKTQCKPNKGKKCTFCLERGAMCLKISKVTLNMP